MGVCVIAVDAAREVARTLQEPFTTHQVVQLLPDYNARTIEGAVRQLDEDGELEGRPKDRGRTHGVRYWRTRTFRTPAGHPQMQFEAAAFLQNLCLEWSHGRVQRFADAHAAD